MKKSMDILIWALLLFLITPSGMALASWNAVPGDATYAWKLTLEKALLLVLSPSDKLASTAEVKIAERRFGEVEQTLDSEYAVEGLQNLNRQLAVTSTNIQKINETNTRSQANEQYLASLKKMSVTLKEQKAKAQTGQIAAVAQKSTTPASTNTDGSSRPISSAYNVYNIYNIQPTGTSARPTPRPTHVAANTGNNGGTTVVNNITNVTNVTTTTTTTTNTTNTVVAAPTNVADNPSADQTSVVEIVSAIEETQTNVDQTIEILEQIQENANLTPKQEQKIDNFIEKNSNGNNNNNSNNNDNNENGNTNNGNELNNQN